MAISLLQITSVAKKYGINFVANIFQQGVRFLILYVSAKILGPAQFATLSLLLLLANYLLNSNLGAINGIKRQIPLFYTKKGNDYVLGTFFSILNFNWIATAITSILVGFALYSYFDYSFMMCLLLMLIAFLGNTYFSVQTYFISTGKWQKLFKLQITCAFLLAITFLTIYTSNITVLLIAYAASFGVSSFSFFLKYGYQVKLDSSVVRENITVGFPVMLSGFIYLFFQTTDRLLVSYYYPKQEFGYYSFAWVLVLTLNLVVNLSSEIILQRGATFYSNVQDKIRLFNYLLKYSMLLQALLVIVALLLLIAVRYLVPIYFEAYKQSIPIIINLVIAYLIQQLALCAANFYYIIGKQNVYNIMLIASCVMNAGILMWPIFSNNHLPKIELISQLYVWSSCLYIILMYAPLVKGKLFYAK
jgi:O-antigen/teichoic acid export membrane protein